jgi:hypothetical protein
MDDEGHTQVELIINCGIRRKPFYDMCRMTTRQEFIEQMRNWLGDEFPQNYTAFFYDKNLTKMTQLDDNEICYLAPIFDSISVASQGIGAQPLSSNDYPHIELYISIKDSSIPSGLSSEAFAGSVSFNCFCKLTKY